VRDSIELHLNIKKPERERERESYKIAMLWD
jgi:hypothetical protein